MKKYLTAAATAITLVVALFLLSRLVLPLFTPKNGFLQVSTSLPAKISLDNKNLGESPFRGENLKTGTHRLQLEAKFSTASSKVVGGRKVSWTGNISLYSNVLSVVNFDFGPTAAFNASEILTLRKGSTSISVVSQPENTEVSLDGSSLGATPLVKSIKSGVHRLKLSKENYLERQIDINVADGFQTVIQVDLALNPLPKAISKLSTKESTTFYDLSTLESSLFEKPDQWAEAAWFFQEKTNSLETKFDAFIDRAGTVYYYDQASFKASLKAKKSLNVGYLGNKADKVLSSQAKANWEKLFPTTKVAQIQVLSTPTGILNVRSGPSQSERILTKIKPGEKYPLLGEQEGWYKIKVGSITGWVSAQYAKKL
ncbi:MAG: PEGA domain-containing protein [bacterium]|nr:PEGA domain-containing protein [bacterium]